MQEPVEPSAQPEIKKSALASIKAVETANTTPQTAPRQGTNSRSGIPEKSRS